MTPSGTSYHHGNLRAELLDHAAAMVAEVGPDRVTLRRLATAAGVSHAAPAHHFGDRCGLFTALAAQGFERLAAALGESVQDFAGQAVRYVRFALDHPGHYPVMFDAALVHTDDPALVAAMAAARARLDSGAAQVADEQRIDTVRLVGFSVVHGFATLWLNGALDPRYTAEDPETWVRRMTAALFTPAGTQAD
ncbi:TetR family transcriptional regulator [Enemella evansiae]|uniref:TetR family transcriptional regulator n=1 Tax=Enemella evansiae TaxID=2016499 RepID=A0A255G9T4_9ACTN|nr:TetR/AcrR family transcriptional regulator [Enemella evansiae]OYO12659.1 TetR family transcriptional regulator [Enemella evansiae]